MFKVQDDPSYDTFPDIFYKAFFADRSDPLPVLGYRLSIH